MSEAADMAVVIGVSAGGFSAMHKLLPRLPQAFAPAVIVVQHRMETGDNYLVESLNAKCPLRVKEAEARETILPGIIYFAPGGYHLLIEDTRTFSISVDDPVNYSRPSIDVLFETAAEVYGKRLIGIILTGANNDGKEGLRAVKAGGGITIVQEPAEAEADVMPLAAIATRAVDHVLPLNDMAPLIIKLAETRHA